MLDSIFVPVICNVFVCTVMDEIVSFIFLAHHVVVCRENIVYGMRVCVLGSNVCTFSGMMQSAVTTNSLKR